MRENNKPTESVESLRALKRRIYVWALAIGLLAILASWIPKSFDGTTTAYTRLVYPATVVMCLGLLIVLLRTRIALVWVESILFAVTALSLLGRFYEILFTSGSSFNLGPVEAFFNVFFWFPLVYILAFLLFENRRQLLIGSLSFFAASVILGMTYVIQEWLSERQVPLVSLLLSFYLANATYIILLMLSVRLNEQYVRVHTLAETMTHLAHTDTLIHIANRRELDKTIARDINRATRHR